MIKKLSLFVTTSLFTISAQAYAPWQKNYEPRQYLRLESGFMINNQLEKDTDSIKYQTNKGVFGGVATGLELHDEYRAEVECLYTPPTKTKFEGNGERVELQTSHAALIANVYYAPKNFEIFKPYAFFGMGYSRNRTSSIKVYKGGNGLMNIQRRGGNTHYVWNIGGGLTFDVTNNLLCDIGYRFIDYGTVKSSIRGRYGPGSNPAQGTYTDANYSYEFGKVKSYQISMSLRYFVN
jgi:opacity protein-like surface antigen